MIPAQVAGVPGICTIVVDVVGKGVAATYTNSIAASNVTGTIHGTSTVISNPSAASAQLRVLAITIGVVKGFNPLTVFGGSSSTLTIQLSNPNSVPLSGISLTDNLPQGTGGGMTVANPPVPWWEHVVEDLMPYRVQHLFPLAAEAWPPPQAPR